MVWVNMRVPVTTRSHSYVLPFTSTVKAYRTVCMAINDFPLPWRGFASRRSTNLIADQFLVCQPTPEHSACGLDESVAIINLAFVVPKRLLIQITEQVKWLDTNVGAFDTTLEQRPEVFDSIGMHVSANVLFSVIHKFVDVLGIEAGIGRQFIGEEFRAAGDVRLYVFLQSFLSAVRYVLDVNFSGLPIQQADNQFLTRTASTFDFYCFLILVHETRETANKSLVGFNRASTAEFLKASTLHRPANPVHHKPRGLLSYAQISCDFVATNPVLTVDDQPHSDKPFVERERTILEDGTDLDRELPAVMLLATFPQPPRRQETHLLTSAVWAHDATGPTQLAEQRKRAIRIGEIADDFDQGFGPRDVFHAFNLAGERG